MQRIRVGLVGAVLLGAGPLAAQDAAPLRYDAELGASMFFGASEQTTVMVRNRLEWTDTRAEFSVAAAFDYGEARDGEGDRFVSSRSWLLETAADYLPGGRTSPFVFATAEGSLERQIDLRTSGGVGAKYRIRDAETGRVDLSLAALMERTDPRARVGVEPEVTSAGRWSGRFRVRQSLGEAAEFQLISFYRPAMGDFDDYTWDLTASMSYRLSHVIGLRVSMINKFDSEAEDRGARSNHDGRVLFSVLATFQ